MRWTRGAYNSPGVYLEHIGPERTDVFRTGVPAFLGFPGAYARSRARAWTPTLITRWTEFEVQFGEPWTIETDGGTRDGSYLWYAVRGFFQNGGEHCYIVPIDAPNVRGLRSALDRIAPIVDIDLVCFPDLFGAAVHLDVWPSPTDVPAELSPAQMGHVQEIMVAHCHDVGGRMAILDTARTYQWENAWKLWQAIPGEDGAIYHPWIRVRNRNDDGVIAIPPSGHVAGVFTRTDKQRGVHKAPANEVLRGVVDLDQFISSAEQDFLNPKGINCIRSFPGRGIRIWGARTLANHSDWKYVNVRRVFLTAIRWLQTFMWGVAFEPNNTELQRRVERELTAYFNGQFRRGALKGRTPEEAFYVKCNAETNPKDSRDAGRLVTEIGLALSVPLEFVVVRLIYGETGVQVEGPVAAMQHT